MCEPKMKSLDVMTLMGQDIGLVASYNKPTVEMLLTEYLKAVDNLTINKVQTNEEVIKNQYYRRNYGRKSSKYELKEQMNDMQQALTAHKKFFDEKVWPFIERQKKEEEDRREMFSILNQESPGWIEPYLGRKYGKGKPFSKIALKKFDRALEWLKTQLEDTSPD